MKEIAVSDEFPPDFFSALGHLVVAFGRIEYVVKLTVKTLLGKGFTQGMFHAETESLGGFKKLCEKGKEVASEKLSTLQVEEYSELLAEAINLADERNNHVHAFWTVEEGKPKRYRPRVTRKQQTKAADWCLSGTVEPHELIKSIKKMQSLYQRIDQHRSTWPVPAQADDPQRGGMGPSIGAARTRS